MQTCTKPSIFSERSLLGAAYDQPEHVGKRKTYLLLTTPRSGSHYLAHSLAALGYGIPAEYFNAELTVPDLMQRWHCSNRNVEIQKEDFNSYLDNALRRRTTANGYWGAKIHILDAKTFFRFPRMHRIIRNSRLILLSRRDLLGQAISLHIALKTKNFFRSDEPVEAAAYDFDSIKRKLDTLLAWDTDWKRWLAYSGLDYLDTTYENIMSDPKSELDRILGYLTESPISIESAPEIQISIQRNELNSAMRSRFLEDLAHPGNHRNNTVTDN